ncbi:SusD/RagB family nutrient-binding outer membrane lipoprotein [Marinilabiliaceae bacterium JC017]|nr:SusD/RagB family nutrient-binding outer membrane lipoprotein [Marinilabiliaceae bacterium JC017]
MTMKRKTNILIYTLMGLFYLASCSDSLTDKNINPLEPAETNPKYLLPTAQSIIMGHVFNNDVNSNITMINAQYFSQTDYADESNWNFREGMLSSYTSGFYDAIKQLDEIRRLLDLAEEGAYSKEELASWNLVLTTLETYCYQNITDVNGPAVYSEAMDIKRPTPKYDSQKDIYSSLLENLSQAIQACDGTVNIKTGEQDMIYSGDISKWQKFANSMLLRCAMRVIERPELNSAKYIAIARDTKNGGLINSNNDIAGLKYLDSPSGNQMYESSYNNSSLPLVASNTIYDLQEKLNDPRIDLYWENPWGDNGGLNFGSTGSWWSYSCINQSIIGWKNKYNAGASWADRPTANFPGIFIDKAEVDFFLSEAAVRGVISDIDATQAYNDGIKASIEFYANFTDPSLDLSDEIESYIAGELVNLNLASSPEDKLERIGEQKWLALWLQGAEGWTEIRRLDSPKLNRPSNPVSTVSDFPTRLKFSSREKDINSANVKKAIEMMGQSEDLYTTKLWWDIK